MEWSLLDQSNFSKSDRHTVQTDNTQRKPWDADSTVGAYGHMGILTRVDEHVLFEVLDAGESDPTGGALEGSRRSFDAGPVRWANVEVVRILDILQPGDTK